MPDKLRRPKVAIIDYGMGNLFSIKNMCSFVNLDSLITHLPKEILNADAVILPGVGAFGHAMQTLERLNIVETLKEAIQSEKPFVGICLGMQLLMTQSHEFGISKGLNIIEGAVIKLVPENSTDHRIKIPHIGWNKILANSSSMYSWNETALSGLNEEEFMYFVHSYCVSPKDRGVILSTTNYGGFEFCSSLQYKNIFACQFHPERSGPMGLKIYKNLSDLLYTRMGKIQDVSNIRS